MYKLYTVYILLNILYACLKYVSWLCAALYNQVPLPTEGSISLLSPSFNRSRNITIRNIYLIVVVFDQVLLWIITYMGKLVKFCLKESCLDTTYSHFYSMYSFALFSHSSAFCYNEAKHGFVLNCYGMIILSNNICCV